MSDWETGKTIPDRAILIALAHLTLHPRAILLWLVYDGREPRVAPDSEAIADLEALGDG